MAVVHNALEAYNLSRFEDNSLSYHRLAEIFRFAYAKRSKLGDPNFVDVTEVRGVFVDLDALSGAFAIGRFSLSM